MRKESYHHPLQDIQGGHGGLGFFQQCCKCKASPWALAGELGRGVTGRQMGKEGLVVAAALLLSATEVALGDAKKPTPELKRLWKIKSSIWK